MSRLTDLIAQAKAKDPMMGADLEREFKALSSRRSFGLNFERHRPETVELPQRPVRKGDKVHVLPPRGETSKGDQRIWTVKRFESVVDQKIAHLVERDALAPETKQVDVSDLVVVAEFRDKIYPGLVSTGKVKNGGGKPFHSVINGENYHALKALTFTHRGKIDAIYIDPPYNTGAKDWKYNNDYVESEDLYRHSKWLAFMERRLKIARELLNPEDSVLIATIDEKEYLRLGLLLEQTFPEATIQMVSSVINPKGSSRSGRFSRVDEYLFFVFLGGASVSPWQSDMLRAEKVEGRKVRWAGLIRNGEGSRRERIPSMFYPIFIDAKTGKFHSTGTPPPLSTDIKEVASPEGTITMWPIDKSGQELMWRLNPDSLNEYLKLGHAKFGRREPKTGLRPVYYLQKGIREQLLNGEVIATGKDSEGALVLEFEDSMGTRSPATVWNMVSHSASEYGAGVLKQMIPGRRFPYPKSVYAVEDTLRFVLKNKPRATVLDFFAGSGTTCHAIMKLNKQDGGLRTCLSVTNNEVAVSEQKGLIKRKLRPGDASWDELGICEYITKPRIRAAISGLTPEGDEIKGDYKFSDEFPMAQGFRENVEFFTLTYETPIAINHNLSFSKIAPLLWLRAGSKGEKIDKIPEQGWEIAETYGVLLDLDKTQKFCSEVKECLDINIVYIITNDDRRFQSVVRNLPKSVEAVRLYESYLNNFQFTNGE
ncbi:site-specific DNA-methyltransferase [Vibrio scophthalmi]|uniref:site-specific DNA-methyltransferase n=1 Tax=Vibrio scophthalmi TaxID=45658 RepID=UPI003EBF8CE7